MIFVKKAKIDGRDNGELHFVCTKTQDSPDRYLFEIYYLTDHDTRVNGMQISFSMLQNNEKVTCEDYYPQRCLTNIKGRKFSKYIQYLPRDPKTSVSMSVIISLSYGKL